MVEYLGQLTVWTVHWMAGGSGFPLSTVWALVLAASLLPVIWAMLSRRSGACFAGLLVGTVVFSRLPYLAVPELNVDESSQVVAARSLLLDPVLYRSVDTETIGPVNIYPMAALQAFGIKPGLGPGRLYAGLLWAALAVLFYGAMSAWYGEAVGRAAGLVGLVLAQGLEFDNFASNPTELMSVALAMGAVWVLAAAWQRERWSRGSSVLMGVVLGAMALSKLQAAPVGLVLLIAACVLMKRKRARMWREWWWMVGCGVVPTVAFAGWISGQGYGGDLLMSWLVRNALLRGGTGLSLGHSVGWAVMAPLEIADLRYLAWAVGASVAGGGFLRGRSGWGRVMLSVSLLIAGVWAAAFPREEYAHHLLYLVPGALLLVGVVGAELGRARASLVLASVAMLLFVMRETDAWHACFYGEPARVATNVATAAAIKRVARPGDRVALWGWCPAASVLSGVPLGTRFPQSAMQLGERGEIAEWAVNAFARDLEERQPRLLVDCVAPGQFRFEERGRDAVESRAAMEREVRAHYVEVGFVDGVRVMERRR